MEIELTQWWNPLKLLGIYFLLINLYSLANTAFDKWRAKSKGWRVPEARFFLLALLGGAVGIIIGMYTFRHKTMHLTFVFGIPVLGIINAVLVYYLLIRF